MPALKTTAISMAAKRVVEVRRERGKMASPMRAPQAEEHSIKNERSY
jgi:hypothetical protein